MNWFDLSKFSSDEIPQRKLGNTGVSVSILSLGGQGSLESQGDEENCTSIIRRAFELGINYFDTSPVYDDSELYYGKALKGIRNDVFLATKTDDRTRDGSLKLIEKSLDRLETDYIDLWQIHHLENNEELDQIFSKDGALKAAIKMLDEGVIKFIGLTGHEDPKILLEAMKRYDFDTVLCPVNACSNNMEPSFIKTVVKNANKQNMGIIGMKVFSQGYIFNPNGITTVWEPLIYSLSQPISNIIVGVDTIAQLEENVAIAKSFQQLNSKKIKEIETKTNQYKKRACFYRKEFGGYQSKKKLSDWKRS